MAIRYTNTMHKMTLSEELAWRGFVNQTTFGDIKALDGQEWTFYHGFDASADSQTIGNLAAMMFDKVFLRHGHKAVLLAGGATSLIGDPGGKDKERVLQTEETIAHNIEQAKSQLKIVFEGYDFEMVNNIDWFKQMNVMQFLRDVGKYFSMTPLVQRDYIATRMGEGGAGISYTEFSYTLLQGYDFLHLFKNKRVNLQLAGSDQWGNCLSGVDLVRRATGQEVHAITCPLVINQATGKKFGKTEEGAVWLDPAKTSAYKFYQFWLNVDDEGVEGYLKVYTELDKPNIDSVMEEFWADRAGRAAQKRLAYEVTKLIHGEERAISVRKVSEVLFGGGDYTALEPTDFEILKTELPVVESRELGLTALLIQSGLASSNTEARRFVGDRAIYINGVQINEGQTEASVSDILHGHIILRRGKNGQAIIKVINS